MICVQDHDQVHCLGQDRVDLVFLGRHGMKHVKEVFRVGQFVARIDERLSDGVFVRPGGNRRHLGDQPERADAAALRVVDVKAVMIECRQRANHAAHHRHRMGVAAEPVIERPKLLMQHRVQGHALLELRRLRLGRQLAVQQQVEDFQKVGLLGQLLDRISAIQQDTLVPIYISDFAVT